MHIINFVLILIQALKARAPFIPESIYDKANEWQNQDPPYPYIDITVWSSTDCGASQHDRQQTFAMDANANNEKIDSLAQSYWLSRDLVNTEILDWSACNHTVNCGGTTEIPGACMVWVQRTSPDSNHNALLARTCYVLTPGATVSHLPREEQLA